MGSKSHQQAQPDASFHDIGKIVSWDAVGLRGMDADGRRESDPHEFQKCIGDGWDSPEWGIDPSAAPWQSILTWHKRWAERYTKSMHRWHTKAADWLASGYARPLSEEERKKLEADATHVVHRLWARDEPQPDARLRTEQEVRDMSAFLNSGPAWEAAVDKYGDQLRIRPEDERPGFDVTSLLAHSTITGKLARALARGNWSNADPPQNPTRKGLRSLSNPPRLIVSHFRLGFRQRPFRARDLGIFARMENALTEIVSRFPDNVLSRFGLECVAAFESAERRQEFVRALEDAGFTIDEKTVDRAVGEYLPLKDGQESGSRSLMMVLDTERRPAYVQEPPARIDLPICEGCQMARATKHWPKDHLAQMEGWSETTRGVLKSSEWREISLVDIPGCDREKLASWLEEWGEEDLCDQCFDIRWSTQPVALLRDWEGDVVYLRIALDLDRLAGHERVRGGGRPDSALGFLHREYLRSVHPQIEKDVLDDLFVSFPLVVDFVRDYEAFLDESRQAMDERFRGRTAGLGAGLACIGVEKKSEVLDAIGIVAECSGKAFPRLLDLPGDVRNPISIALSLSKKKHPFFDHWRFLDKPEPDVSIQVVSSGRAVLRLCDLGRIVTALRGAKRSQLHRLAAAASVSRELGRVVLREQDKRGIVLAELSALVPDTLDFESARVVAGLMEG